MRIKLIACIMLALLLSGCATGSIEASLRVPELPAEFVEFNDELSKIKASGMELIAPSGGTNRQSVQLADLDGDGIDEGVAFFREMANTYKTYAYIFKKVEHGYQVSAKIDGAGDSVDSVTYTDILGTGNNEIIIGWSVSDSDARSVTAHSIHDGEVQKLCEIASLYYLSYDINSDMVSDLCVVNEDPTDGNQRLEVYMAQEGSLTASSNAPLSNTSDKILRIRAAYATDGVPAIFVEKEYDTAGVVTDVIVWENGALDNITFSEATGYSEETARSYVAFCEDVDGDGALEIPILQGLAKPYRTIEGEALPGIVWHGFDEKLRFISKAYSFRSSSENWQIMLPLDWESEMVATCYKDGFNKNSTTFYAYREASPPKPIFSIIALAGENREKRLEQLGYEKIFERADVIYAVDIDEKRYLGYDITAEMLAERISYHNIEWSTGEVVF